MDSTLVHLFSLDFQHLFFYESYFPLKTTSFLILISGLVVWWDSKTLLLEVDSWPILKPISISHTIPQPWWLAQGWIWDPIRCMKHHPGRVWGIAETIFFLPKDREWELLDPITWRLRMMLVLPIASQVVERNQSLIYHLSPVYNSLILPSPPIKAISTDGFSLIYFNRISFYLNWIFCHLQLWILTDTFIIFQH